MGDPNHSRFDHTQRRIAQTRYGFVLDKFLQVEPDQTVTQTIPSLENDNRFIGLRFFSQYQAVSCRCWNSNHPLKRLTPGQLGLTRIESRKFPSVEIILLSHQFVSRLLTHHKYLLRQLPNWISLQQYALVAGDTS